MVLLRSKGEWPGMKAREKKKGFTLIELLLSLAIMSIIMTLTFLTFSTVTKAWQMGQALSEDLHHGEFVMEQLVMGLMSSYYSGSSGNSKYGFWLDSMGGSDEISWVKLGTALVGDDCKFAGSPHRVIVSIEPDEDGRSAVAVRAWRLADEPEDFDSDELEPIFLSTMVTSIKCEPRDPEPAMEGDVEWMNEWEETNRLPVAVKITLALEPLEEDGEPIEIQRAIEIPVAPLSWSQGSASSRSVTPPSGGRPRRGVRPRLQLRQ